MTNARRSYPEYKSGIISSSMIFHIFWSKIFPCIIVGAFLIPSLVTIFTGKGSLLVNSQTLGIASAWVLVRYTFMSQLHKGKKFLIQIFNASLLLYILDQITLQKGWALNYAIPGLIMVSTLAMLCVVYKNKKLWSDYAVYLLTLIFLGFLPFGLYFVKATKLFWPGAVSAGFALIVLIIVYFFLDKNFKSFFNRRLHF